ncbi:MAG: hypothetical protein HETSPECPRED_008760 [Heterodermia speciosa]|uniref:NmrA-like domain-containing protein n=1 Tax=Heterodermia speciosa TaxID=116794 RepID=A0A8H3ICU6_9LECA|nr:MAG: hypothetical protein HETSPECPRED_008760 [Heterodermia speciosa]
MVGILTVFGATGKQGGSVVRTILSHPTLSAQYKVRAVTRDPSKPAAEALKTQGVEVVKADLNDKDSVHKAVEGSQAVFGVTDFWSVVSKDGEIAQGNNIADACKAAGVEHFIWSSLAHASKVSGGKLAHMHHFDSKAEVEEFTRSLGVPATFFYAGAYMSNIPGALQKNGDEYTLAWNLEPGVKMPLFDADDTGKFVSGILLQSSKLLGQRVFGATDWYTPDQVVSTIEKVSGKKATYQALPDEVFKGFLPPLMAEELTETLIFMREYAYYGPEAEEGVKQSLQILDQKPTTLEQFFQKTDL